METSNTICCPPGELAQRMIGVDNQTVPTQGDEVQLRAETHPDTFIDDRIVFLILGRYYPKFAPGVQMNNVGQVMTSGEMLWRDNETNYTSPSLLPTSLFVNIAIEATFAIFITIHLDDRPTV